MSINIHIDIRLQNIRQNPMMLHEDFKYLTRVATHVNLTYNIKDLMYKTHTYIN